MNERIEKLAEQCRIETYGVNGELLEFGFDQEKFAELIVQECADILMKPEYAMNHPEELSDYNKGWVNGRLLGVEHIKEYFGVVDERTNSRTY
jgi:hypothetical protein